MTLFIIFKRFTATFHVYIHFRKIR